MPWPTKRALVQSPGRHLLCLLLLAISMASTGCRPRHGDAPVIDDSAFSECRDVPVAEGPNARGHSKGLFAAARGAGIIAAANPAERWIDQQTRDGYRLRGALSTGFFALTLLVVGALGAALVLAMRRRKPRPPWGDELLRRLVTEIRALRDLGTTSDAMATVVARFTEPLDAVQARGKDLAERCHNLAKRHESTAARGHLVSAEDDLGRLLELVEHLVFQLDAWKSRAEIVGDETIETTITSRIADLDAALEATK